MAVLGPRFCARALSSRGKRGPLPIAARRPPTTAASPAAELLRSMWDPPRPGPEPACPELAGRFSTTAPPRKPFILFLKAGVYHRWLPLIQYICSMFVVGLIFFFSLFLSLCPFHCFSLY